jgi:hypothetical protein
VYFYINNLSMEDTMKVKELYNQLQNLDPDLEIVSQWRHVPLNLVLFKDSRTPHYCISYKEDHTHGEYQKITGTVDKRKMNKRYTEDILKSMRE